MDVLSFIPLLYRTCIEAGNAILNVYSTNFEIETKSDKSPVTQADMLANKIIINALKTTGLPIISEESPKTAYHERKQWEYFWLVDPLDGTREFVKRNDEFTVNIALIRQGVPLIGFIYAPVLDILYFNDTSTAYKVKNAAALLDTHMNIESILSNATPLPLSSNDTDIIVAVSRSYLDAITENYIETLQKKLPQVQKLEKGSSLKLCMIAEGTADLYPRFSPINEWDIAAGHAIVQASGGRLLQIENQKHDVVYNQANLRTPAFLAVTARLTAENYISKLLY